MKITKITSHVLQYDLPKQLGYSQQYYSKRTAHLVEVKTDEGVIGCEGNVSLPLPSPTKPLSNVSFNRLESRGLSIAQPEVCALDGISEYLRVLALCHAHFTPVVNHVWGSAIAVATNMHLLAAMPPLPGGMFPWEPMLEFDTTNNKFRDELLLHPLNIQDQVKKNNGRVSVPTGPGLGVDPDQDFIRHFEIS